MSFTFLIHFSPTTQTRADDNTNCIKLINSFVVDTDGMDNLNTGIRLSQSQKIYQDYSLILKRQRWNSHRIPKLCTVIS